MISTLKKKLNKKGFTLAELLVVVAIIAILVAIAIPVFNGQLTKAKIAADNANVRAWYAECIGDYLTDEKTTSVSTTPTDKVTVGGVEITLKVGKVKFVEETGKNSIQYVPNSGSDGTLTLPASEAFVKAGG